MIFLCKQTIDFVYIYYIIYIYPTDCTVYESCLKVLNNTLFEAVVVVVVLVSLLTLSLNLVQLCSQETQSEVERKLVRKTYVISGLTPYG